MLRHVVETLRKRAELQILAITSPAVGDGKTLTAINLAGALAQAGDACGATPRMCSKIRGVDAIENLEIAWHSSSRAPRRPTPAPAATRGGL